MSAAGVDGRAAPLPVTLHGPCGPAGSALDGWLRAGDHQVPGTRSVVGPLPAAVADLTGPADLLAEAAAGLADGPARPEAMAVRLRRRGVPLIAGEPTLRLDAGGWVRWCYQRGRDSVPLLRADPSLLPELQAGSWWAASPAYRALRRAQRLTGASLPAALPGLARRLGPAAAGDLAFWAGVRSAATGREWARLTGSSYVVLCYHRVAGEMKPGQERMDLPPARFRRQLAALRLLGWRPLPPAEMVAFHRTPDAVLGRRRYVVTLDDAFADAVTAASGAGRHRPQMFAVTAAVGGTGDWLAGEPLAGWPELAELCRRGGVVGSHARHHVRLDGLADDEIEAEVAGSLADLRQRLPLDGQLDGPLIAYPHGAHDQRVRAAAIAAGYAAGYSSLHGRNGAGTDLYSLRRVEPKAFDGPAVFLWKVLTGANRPPAYRRLLRLARSRMPRRSGTSAAPTRLPR